MQISLPALDATRTATFYHRHGDVFGWSCVGITLLGIIGALARRRKKLPR
jgi:apolipoprotein N-acyltransferase